MGSAKIVRTRLPKSWYPKVDELIERRDCYAEFVGLVLVKWEPGGGD